MWSQCKSCLRAIGLNGWILGTLYLVGCDTGGSVGTEAQLGVAHPLDSKQTEASWSGIYGPRRDAIVRQKSLQTTWGTDGPVKLWSRKIGKGYAAPVIASGKAVVLYRVGEEEILDCVDAVSGVPIWSQRYPSSFQCEVEYSDGPYSTPIINADRVFAFSAEGTLRCWNLSNGQQIWQRDLVSEFKVELTTWPVVSSPLIFKNKIIFNLGAKEKKAGMIALDTSDGKTIWTATDHTASHSSPILATIHGRTRVYALTDIGLICLDPDSGIVDWSIPHRSRQRDYVNAVSPVVCGDWICVVAGPTVRPGLRCFHTMPDGSYEEPWSNIKLLNTQYTNLVATGGYLFGCTPMKQGGCDLKCIDVAKGKLCWKDRPSIGRANLLAVDNSLLLLGEYGDLASVELNPNSMVIKAKTDKPLLEKPCYTPMAMANGRLYLRNEQVLVCFDMNQ